MAYIILKLMLKRFFISKSLTNRSHFKSKSTLSKDEYVETTTPGSGIDDQLKVVHRQPDFSDSAPQSFYSILRGSEFYQVAFRRQCSELAMHSHFPSLEFARVVGQCQPDVVLLRSQRASSQTYHDWQNAAKSRPFSTSIAAVALFSASFVVGFFSMLMTLTKDLESANIRSIYIDVICHAVISFEISVFATSLVVIRTNFKVWKI